jgi:hypothetical protein
MPSIESIEHKLLQLDASSFQRMGDEYFSQCADIKFKEFKPIGLTPGKRAPKKGTPDTLIELNSGRYILIEYTTKVRGEKKTEFLNKFKGDLSKCFQPKSTGIEVKDINTIILTTNQIVGIKERNEILASIKVRDVMVEIRDLHFWSQEIRRFSFLARTYLNLTSETKQVLNVNEFVEEYEYGGLSTPLSNIFLHRETELKNADESLTANNIYVISGPPGVGKTKVALEAATRYSTANNIELYCLKDKGSWSLDDVRTYFYPNKRYLVLIDDANRHLKLLRHMINTQQEGLNVKLILTVRDYALQQVKENFEGLNIKIETIGVLEDRSLLDIVRQVANFNRIASNRILELAKGNPRLALMAARIVKETNTLSGVTNASGIFDEYYNNIVKDHKIFSAPQYLKCLGVISVFKSMDISSQDSKSLLKVFNIKQEVFLDAINALEEIELVEIDGDLVRITEQNFQAYSFYKVFISEKKLSISTLLRDYFPKHSSSVKDIILSANNAFGYENMFKTIYGPLVTRLKGLQHDDEKHIFFESFWYYCPTELFGFVKTYIDKLPDVRFNEAELIDSYYLTSKYFRLLISFLDYNNENFLPALELLIEFTEKKPDHYKQLVDTIKGRITYDEESYPKYVRQSKYLKLITDNWRVHSIYPSLFFDSANHFFYSRFTISTATYKRNAIALEQHRAFLNVSLKKQRKLIWDFLFKKFNDSPVRVVKILSHYSDHRIDLIEEFIAIDAPYIFKIFSERFDETNLSHSLCVSGIDDLLKRFKVGIELPTDLKSKFLSSKTFCDYRTLSWSREQERLDVKGDFQRYYDLKSKKVINVFKNSTLEEIMKLTIEIINWHKEIESHHLQGIYNSLDVLSNHFLTTNKRDLFWGIVESIAGSGNPNSFIPYKTLTSISTREDLHESFCELVGNTTFKSSLNWYGTFIHSLTRIVDSDQYVNFLFSLIEKEKNNIYFDFHWLEKISTLHPSIYNDVLERLILKWKELGTKVYLDRSFFKEPSQFGINKVLLEEAYIMQYLTTEPYFDYNGESFGILIDANESFLISFCKNVFEKKDFRGSQDASFLKGLAGNSNLPKLTNQFLNYLASNNFLYPDDFHNSLNETFNKTNLSFKDFLGQYLSRNAKNLKRAKLVAEIVDEVFKSQAPHFLKIFLKKNKNIEHFKEINWSTMGGFFGGNTNISELYLSRWMSVKSVLKDFESIKYLAHRQYVDDMVFQYQVRARNEAKELFLKKSFYDD